jgi:SAM-dependent methyltransferase
VIFQAHLSLYEYAARLVKGKRVLDAGCGTGYGSLALAKAGAQAVLAVDSDEMIIDRAMQRFQHPALTFQAADLLSLSLDPGSLDVVYASNILHQLTDVDRFLDRVLPALSAGAVLFVAVPHIWSAAALEQNLQSKHHLWNLHPRQWMSKIGRYFGEVECLRHWLNAGVTPDWSPTSLLKAADFAFEREELSALMSSGETVSLVLVARRPRRTPLPAALEAQGYPITWDAKVVQAAQSRIQTALRQEQSSDPEPLAAAHPTSAAASADVAGSKTESKTESSAESGAALAALVAPAGGTDGTDSTDSTDGADLATLLQNVPPAPSEATPDQPLRFPLDALFAEVEPPSVASMGLRFKESALAHHFLDGLSGLEIGAAAHNTFGLRTQNVGITAAMDAEDYEFYKAAQISYCGTYAEIDIPGLADDIPVPESSQDFVLHSHVWEHLPNPLGALEEWVRVVRSGGYIFAIVPKRNSEPSDVDRPITTLEEHIRNYDLRSTHPERGLRDGTLGLHYSLFTPETLRQIGAWFNAHHPAVQLSEVAFMETDDKVGNGHLIVWQVLERPTA